MQFSFSILGGDLATGSIFSLHAINLQHGIVSMVTTVTMGGDLQPGCLADRLLTGLGQPQINP